MRVSIMQPYFFPYLGYFQLISSSDVFIIYDNIKFTKKGWINRNRILVNGHDALFSLPLKKASDFLDVRERELSEAFDRAKLLSQFAGAYGKAPQFATAFREISAIVSHPATNLFDYIHNSVIRVCAYLGIRTKIVVSSTLPIEHQNNKAQDKVIALCKALNATEYLNPIGGAELYDRAAFRGAGLDLFFLKMGDVRYPQFNDAFVPSLSIIDVMMFNSVERIYELLPQHALV